MFWPQKDTTLHTLGASAAAPVVRGRYNPAES